MFQYICNFNTPGTKTIVPRVDTAPNSVETPTPPVVIADSLGFVEPTTHMEDKVPSPDQTLFHTSSTSTHRGRKRVPPGLYRTARRGNANPNGWLLVDFVHPAAPGEKI